MSKLFNLIAPVGLLISSVSCSSMRGFAQPPKLSVTKLSVTSPSLTEAALEFTFNIENPSPIDLTARKLSYAFDLNGKPAASGALESGIQMTKQAVTELKVPLKVRYSDVFTSLQELFANGDAPYVIKGILAVGPFEVPYSHAGQLELPHLPRVSAKGLRPTKGATQGISWTLDLEVENPNKFPIPIDGFEYALNLGNQPALEGKAALFSLPGSQAITVSLPLNLSLSQAGLIAKQLIGKQKTLSYSFSAKLNVPQTEGVSVSQSGAIPLFGK